MEQNQRAEADRNLDLVPDTKMKEAHAVQLD